MVELSADVVVVGAGPAGAAAALLLAPSHRILLVDRADQGAEAAAVRIGESLPAAARRLFRDMGLWDDFLAEDHAPCHGADSFWGGPLAVSTDAVRDPDGPGWHLDRARFDAWLLARARGRGAAVVAPARPLAIVREPEGWRLTLERSGRPLIVTARFLIDAGGRAAPVSRALGHRRARTDRLICRWLHGRAEGCAGRTVVVAEPGGWWYSAALPGGRRVLAFHTDADLPSARSTAEMGSLLARAGAQPGLAELLSETGFVSIGTMGSRAAHSGAATAASGPGWLAVGDAALACDPLSSQGLLNALYSATLARDAVTRALAGDGDATADYRRALDRVATAYRVHLTAWYGLEDRWPDEPFWSRRRPTRGGDLNRA